MHRCLPAVALFLALVVPAAADDILTKDEARDVEAVISSMFAAGWPDTAQAAVHFGPLSVRATFDPATEPMPLPSSSSNLQMTGEGGRMTYGYQFQGLHFALADGSWVISLSYHFRPRPGDSVDASGAQKVDPAGLTAAAAAAHPFHAEKDAAKYLETFAPESRARSAAVLDLFVPISHFLKLRPDDVPQALVMLHRAGWSDAPAAAAALASQRARSYWQLKPWSAPDVPFDPSCAYPGAKQEEEDWRKAHPQAEPEPPATALRRALFRWCRGQMMAEEREDALLPLEAASAAAKAVVDPGDPQHNAARIDFLLAATKLPVTPPDDADLALRLQCWEARTRAPRMVVNGGGGQSGGSMTFTTGFVAPKPAYEPKPEDLDALVGLLADERPSRFWDFFGARTLGDNAWRAAAMLLKEDPRKFAGHPTDRPWTAAERKEASAAVQKWWKEKGRAQKGK